MKKIIFLLTCITFLFAFNQNPNKVETEEHDSHGHAQSTGLSLNNGAKWKADSITTSNVRDLRTIADNFRIQPFPSINEYQILGNDLNKGLNKMIQECKMTGPDHEALHHWLKPILTETNQLKNISDTTVARENFKKIDTRIDDYHNFFE